MQIFYSTNRFIVRQGIKRETDTPVIFLSRLPSKALRYIRHLEYRFDHLGTEHVRCGSSLYEIDWDGIADFFLQHLALSRLHLTLDSSSDSFRRLEYDLDYSELKWAKHVAWLGYLRMAKAFAKLAASSLRKLHIYLSTDMISYGNQRSSNVLIDYLEKESLDEGFKNNERRISDEQKLEKSVMDAEYDSDKEGKYTMIGWGWRIRNENSWMTICRKHRRLGFHLVGRGIEPTYYDGELDYDGGLDYDSDDQSVVSSSTDDASRAEDLDGDCFDMAVSESSSYDVNDKEYLDVDSDRSSETDSE
ncbi:MAG: hypothetical protein MMC33_009326 [Icmadophila ericetorum]|nr:hypothetical protein [Icmadophila ericetorum]